MGNDDNQTAMQSDAPLEKPKAQILKDARESQGLSLATVHEATKIPLDVLRAIEEGYSIRTLPPFYLKGFIKLYAKFLKVDEHLVLEKRQEPIIKPIKGTPDEDIHIEEWIERFLPLERRQQLIVLGAILIVLFLLFKLIVFFTHPKTAKVIKPSIVVEQQQSPESLNVNPNPEQTQSNPPATQMSQPINEKPKTANTNITPVAKDIVLTVRAKEKSWLRVKVDGQVVFQSTLRVGAVEKWMADEKIEIAGRNINQLEFELNGKLIGTLGRKDRTAKGVVITKDGLSVTK